MNILDRALDFAVQAHRGTFRKAFRIPYIVHPIAVMQRAAWYETVDQDVLVACLLHDVVEENRKISFKEIEVKFGSRAAGFVRELTKPEGKMTPEQKEEYLIHLARRSSPEALFIKICDRLCNIEDFSRMNSPNVQRYALEAKPLFDRALKDPEVTLAFPAFAGYLTIDLLNKFPSLDLL